MPTVRQKWAMTVQQPIDTCWQVSINWPVEGSVKGPDGDVLATFEHRRIGVMGVAGGDSLGKLESDTKDIGEDIAKFLSAWAKSKSLK